MIFAPVPPPPPGWTSIVIVLVVTAVIAVWIPAIGSGKPVVFETARGYGWSVAKWSLEQLKTIPPVSIPTVSLVVKPWFGIVRTKIPVWDVYTAFVAVNAWLPAPENAAFLIEPIPELTNLCSYATSVTPTATVPLYPEPSISLVLSPTDVIVPLAFFNAVTAAPTRGATPRPPVDPNDTIIPPLGSWFKLTSVSLTILCPFVDVIPVNVIVVIPAVVSPVKS